MLRITAGQKEAFSRDLLDRFVQRIVAVVKRAHPERCADMTEEAIEEQVRDGIERAESYGLISDDDRFIFVRLTFVVGPAFDMHDFFQEILRDERIAPESRLARLIEMATPEDWEDAASLTFERE